MPRSRGSPRSDPASTIAAGGLFVGPVAYLGRVALLAIAAPRAVILPRGSAPRFLPALVRQLDELLLFGLPLVALVHVPLGAYLAMQAFFHATFTEAVGAVVGLGLLRNMAPMTTGLTLAGLLAVRITPELRCRSRTGLDDEVLAVPDREIARSHVADPQIPPDPARLAAVRLAAAIVGGPVLALWGAIVGTVVGLLVARSMLGVSPAIFVGKILEMIGPADALGLIVKGILFAFLAALLACHEGLGAQREPAAVRLATFRAASLAMVAILAVNSCWFSLAYLSGPPFGPAVATR